MQLQMILHNSGIEMLIQIWQVQLWKVSKNLWLNLTVKQKLELVLKKKELEYTERYKILIFEAENFRLNPLTRAAIDTAAQIRLAPELEHYD